jgi:hypothetical protein
MAQEENKKAKQTAQTQPEETDLTDWDKTQTYMKKGADLKDLETK